MFIFINCSQDTNKHSENFFKKHDNYNANAFEEWNNTYAEMTEPFKLDAYKKGPLSSKESRANNLDTIIELMKINAEFTSEQNAKLLNKNKASILKNTTITKNKDLYKKVHFNTAVKAINTNGEESYQDLNVNENQKRPKKINQSNVIPTCSAVIAISTSMENTQETVQTS